MFKHFFMVMFIIHLLLFSSNLFANISYQSDLMEQKKFLPHFSEDQIRTLIVDRKGDREGSHMKTLGIHMSVQKGKTYKLTSNGLLLVEKISDSIAIYPKQQHYPQSNKVPPHATIYGKWEKENLNSKDDSNILGKNTILTIDSKKIEIPIIKATNEELHYYNAYIVGLGDYIQFDVEEEFPITVMEIGPHYVNDYIMKKGGGFYLEYHNRPHFHWNMGQKNSGYYILGKEVAKNTYHLTAFSIPYTKAVYTSENTIHCDAGLTGDLWVVGYTIAPHYSTALLKNPNGRPIPLNHL